MVIVAMNFEHHKYHQNADQLKTEEQIIAAAKVNPQQFEQLYNKYFLAIYKYVIIRIENKHQTDEIVSKVFSKALFKLKQFKFRGVPFSSWLYRIAYNEINDLFRKKKAERVVQVPLEYFSEYQSLEDDQDDLYEKEKSIDRMLDTIKQLKKLEIELLELRFFEKRSYREIGEIMEITEDNAKVKTHRVIKKLQKLFGAQIKQL